MTDQLAKDIANKIHEIKLEPITINAGAVGSAALASDHYSMSSASLPAMTTDTINWNAINHSVLPNTIWTTTPSTISSGTGLNWAGVGTNTEISQSGKMSLHGAGADIDINGKSLKNWMEKVEERLNILTPDPELEKEWDDLRKLGERYRRLEKKCKEKAEVWKKLKAMPPPKVD